MSAELLVNLLLLVAGLGMLLHYHMLAKILDAEIRLQCIGVVRTEQEAMWRGIVVVAGLALAMTGLLRLLGFS